MKQLRAKNVEIEKTNASTKVTFAKGRGKIRHTIAETRVIALAADLKEVHDARKQSIETAEESEKRATDFAAYLAKSFLHTTEVGKIAKVATARLLDMQKQVVESA